MSDADILNEFTPDFSEDKDNEVIEYLDFSSPPMCSSKSDV